MFKFFLNNKTHCVKRVHIRSFSGSGSYFPAFTLNMGIYGVNIRIQSERRKVRTRKTSIIIFTEKDIEKVIQNLDSNKACAWYDEHLKAIYNNGLGWGCFPVECKKADIVTKRLSTKIFIVNLRQSAGEVTIQAYVRVFNAK